MEYKLAFHVSFGKLLYTFLLVQVFASIPSTLAEGWFLYLSPGVELAQQPGYLLCYLVTHALLLPPFALLLRKITGPAFRAMGDRVFWPLNLLPILFLGLNMLSSSILNGAEMGRCARLAFFLVLGNLLENATKSI